MPENAGWNPTGAINTGVGAIMGLALEGHNDRRQLEQQGKLQKLQMEGQRGMMDYSNQKQLEMWKATNYSAQRSEMEKAGLNPGLMYGMSGGGGTTTGQASGSVQGATAASGGGKEIADQMGMGIQRELLQAQKENIQADTENKKAENPNITTKGEDLKQDVELKKGALKDRLDTIGYEAGIKLNQLSQEINKTMISDATRDEQAQQIKSEAIGAALKNALTEAQTEATKQGKTQSIEQIKVWQQEIAQKWKDLDIKAQDLLMRSIVEQFKIDHPGIGNLLGGMTQRLKNMILGEDTPKTK